MSAEHIKVLRDMKASRERHYQKAVGVVRLLKAILEEKDAPAEVEVELARVRAQIDALAHAILTLERPQ